MLINMEANVSNANLCKDIVINAMISEGYISKERGEHFKNNYNVIISKRTWFQRFYALFRKDRKPDGWFFDVVKFVDCEDGDVGTIEDINILKEMLIKAEQEENFELASKISERIRKLEGK